jgi:hypothetical protein
MTQHAGMADPRGGVPPKATAYPLCVRGYEPQQRQHCKARYNWPRQGILFHGKTPE